MKNIQSKRPHGNLRAVLNIFHKICTPYRELVYSQETSPYAGIIRIRFKGFGIAVSAIIGTPDFYAVF
jgi:hypothetical protein